MINKDAQDRLKWGMGDISFTCYILPRTSRHLLSFDMSVPSGDILLKCWQTVQT